MKKYMVVHCLNGRALGGILAGNMEDACRYARQLFGTFSLTFVLGGQE